MAKQLFTIDEITTMSGGHLLEKQDTFVYGISTDSRTIKKGDLFIPLKGESFDGHDYLKDVASKGAAAAIVSRIPEEKLNMTLIQVKDTLHALQSLSSNYRKSLQCKIVGITGSNGKTTTKFFAETLLSSKYKTFASQKSFNNHFGVPLTLLSLTRETEVGIVEIGMNHSGEISALTKLAEPDIALVTTVGRAHLMDFKGIEGIAKEKSDIYRAAKPDAIKIFNLDNEQTQKMKKDFSSSKSLSFSSQDKSADVFLKVTNMTLSSLSVAGHIGKIDGKATVEVFGAHNVTNLMGAAAIALAAGVDAKEIWATLPRCKSTWGRNTLVQLESGANLIFDGYNANPDSVRALLENIKTAQIDGKRVVILGDMLEMGAAAENLHFELGRLSGESNFDVVWFLGEFSKAFEAGIKQTGFSNKLFISDGYEQSLAAQVASMVEPSDVVVMKGSRGARLEKLVPHFKPVNWN